MGDCGFFTHMLVSFSVANFRSFSDEQTFSLVASNRLTASHESHLATIPDSSEKVLRTAIIYGANGAGKSNLFKAVQFFKQIALRPARGERVTNRQKFLFGDSTHATTDFDMQFITASKLYRFGFRLDDDRIVEEWLVQIIGGREKVIYERTTNESGIVNIDAKELNDEKIRALATVGGPKHQTFLSTVNLTMNTDEIGGAIGEVLNWLKQRLVLISPQQNYAGLVAAFSSRPDLLTFAGEFLRNASTGVDRLVVNQSEISQDEIPDTLLQELIRSESEEGLPVRRIRLGNTYIIQREGDKLSRFSIKAEHGNEDGNAVSLELAEESDGTQRLVNLMPALHDLRSKDATYFIDEIDRSLHPLLVRAFLESFLGCCAGGHRQIIVTTHESSLLDQDLVRRDEIWFAEKDQGGSTRLYSLLDFKVRNDLEIRKHYLQGRFGAIPFLGNIGNLQSQQDSEK